MKVYIVDWSDPIREVLGDPRRVSERKWGELSGATRVHERVAWGSVRPHSLFVRQFITENGLRGWIRSKTQERFYFQRSLVAVTDYCPRTLPLCINNSLL